jgi:hypothetical protein
VHDAEQRGHQNQVAQVANSNPPITARPRGIFCPGSIAMGIMPKIIAMAVISTGRKRAAPASRALARASSPVAIWSRAKAITRMELAVATPMHMIAPVSAGTDSDVPVANSIQTIPASAVGRPSTITSGSSQDWKLTTISRKISTMAAARPT